MKSYKPLLSVSETEFAIKRLKDLMELSLAEQLNLTRVTAPFIVRSGTGINDDLNGVEKPVSFPVSGLNGNNVEIVQSLAKWKRMMLGKMGVEESCGIYTDMNALRPAETPDATHSIYVDQWDWERVIAREERTVDFLKEIVRKIYSALLRVEDLLAGLYDGIRYELPREITFIHAEELLKKYPCSTSKERENLLLRECKAAFIIGIGGRLSNGEIHDGRAPDYDDWSTIDGSTGFPGLNGDLFVWSNVLEQALELSSMGIRVDARALLLQLEIRRCFERKDLFWHKELLKGRMPLSIGGGIGQSRLCMYFLRKAHIGEVQSSVWPDEMMRQCLEAGISLL